MTDDTFPPIPRFTWKSDFDMSETGLSVDFTETFDYVMKQVRDIEDKVALDALVCALRERGYVVIEPT